MKKVILSICVMAACTVAVAQKGGSGSDAKPNVVKVNPLGLLFGNASISYERALNEKSAIQVNGSFGGFSIGGVKYTSLGGGVDYRYYLSNTKTAPEGCIWVRCYY
jgi:hypothetical protein